MTTVENEIKVVDAHDTPEIVLDSEKKILKIKGSSYPENAVDIYAKVFEWLDKLDHTNTPRLDCEFYFNYLNSASRKIVYEILVKLEKIQKAHQNIHITWLYDEFDEDMYDFGDELSDLIKIPFEIHSVEE